MVFGARRHSEQSAVLDVKFEASYFTGKGKHWNTDMHSFPSSTCVIKSHTQCFLNVRDVKIEDMATGLEELTVGIMHMILNTFMHISNLKLDRLSNHRMP